MANYWLSFSGSSPTVWSVHVYLYLGKSQVDFDSLVLISKWKRMVLSVVS
ncbi:hypothetical protein YC2023_040618 [Brassica napus]